MVRTAVQQDIKDRILDATDKLLSEKGFQGMTMSMLADEVGIGKGTLYLHYPSKKELVLSHIDRIIFRLLVKLQEISSMDIPADEKLLRMLVLRVLFRFDSIQHYRESLFDLLNSLLPLWFCGCFLRCFCLHRQQLGVYHCWLLLLLL